MGNRKVFSLLLVFCALVIAYWLLFASPSEEFPDRLVIPLGAHYSQVTGALRDGGFIKSGFGFAFAEIWRPGVIKPGGYKIPDGTNAWGIARILHEEPYMEWVVIPEGLRKEQTAEILGDALGWDAEAVSQWVKKDTAMKYEEIEGVYFPDTYLIPRDEPTAKVAERFRAKFNEKFSAYAKEAAAQNIKWDTLVKVASLIQRESAGAADMPLVSGIIWNRLLKPMKLDIDATLQYAKGSAEAGWWPPVTAADKKIDSPYNTYLHTGLPPHPIANPGIAAIEAALRPAKTKCLYYLHDAGKVIHCAETYEEHKRNIEKYL